jgi:predicted MFS family arabinose efflux permease
MPACRPEPALIVIAAGVCAALHVGKLPPALHALQQALGLSLLQAGFVLSLVQGAGMSLGLAFGALADALGARRSMLIGLLLLAAASAAGGFAQGAASLMLLRVGEGFGFLLVVLPAPGLVRQLAAPGCLNLMLGRWGAYMPLATALALLLGPMWLDAFGWRSWWWALAGLTLAMAAVLARAVPADGTPSTPPQRWWARGRETLSHRGPWLVAMTFAMYSGQWLAVVGFLPSIYLQAGVSGAATGLLTAGVAAANMLGNLGGGRALQAGVAPVRLLVTGFVTMGAASALAFADSGLPPAARYAAVLLFSGVGGLIPATLFTLALRLAPGPGAVSSTVGWVQQWSALGQFAGPPLVAGLAGRVGGWQFTGLATGLCSLAGLGLVALLARQLKSTTASGG